VCKLDRITWTLGCHASSMPSLAVSASGKKFKLTHYPNPAVVLSYVKRRYFAPRMSTIA